MNRAETTKFLSELLVQRKLAGKYYASEVTLTSGVAKAKKNVLILYSLHQKIRVRAELKRASLYSTR